MTESRKKKGIALWMAGVILLAVSCSAEGAGRPAGASASGGQGATAQMQENAREEICLEFLKENMITEQGGVRTNYLDKPGGGELAAGGEVLSESMGLLMLYAAEARDEALFQSALRFVEERLDTGEILSYRYSPEDGVYRVNALVDDMRVIRAMLAGDEAFGGDYLKTALVFADRLQKTNVKDSRLFDMYDDQYGATNDFITLCYIDLDTARRLSAYDPGWDAVFETMLPIAEGGYISDDFPLYAGAFDYASMEYSKDDVSTVQSALTALSLARVGRCPERTLAYLKDRAGRGELYGTYRQNGTPVNDTQSTAIYAICAMLAKTAGDEEMYDLCIGRMDSFQVTDKSSEVYGAFANAKTMDLYAFDNLMALLAYRRGERE